MAMQRPEDDPRLDSHSQRTRAGMIAKAQRRQRVLALAAAGASNARIAELVGSSERGVSQIINNQLRRYQASDRAKIETVRAQQLDRLDRMLVSIWSKVEEGNFRAIDRALRIEQLRSRIAGTDQGEAERTGDGDGRHVHFHLADPAEVARMQESWAAQTINGHAEPVEPAGELEPSTS